MYHVEPVKNNQLQLVNAIREAREIQRAERSRLIREVADSPYYLIRHVRYKRSIGFQQREMIGDNVSRGGGVLIIGHTFDGEQSFDDRSEVLGRRVYGSTAADRRSRRWVKVGNAGHWRVVAGVDVFVDRNPAGIADVTTGIGGNGDQFMIARRNPLPIESDW